MLAIEGVRQAISLSQSCGEQLWRAARQFASRGQLPEYLAELATLDSREDLACLLRPLVREETFFLGSNLKEDRAKFGFQKLGGLRYLSEFSVHFVQSRQVHLVAPNRLALTYKS